MDTEIITTNDSSDSFAFLCRQAPRLAFGLLVLWCLLPVFMVFYAFAGELMGLFPDVETMTELGYSLGYTNYTVFLDTYALAFRVLGVATVAFALCVIVMNWGEIASRVSLREQPWYYLLLALLFWTVLSALFSDNFARAFLGGHYRFDGLSSYFIYGSAFVCASLIREDGYRRRLIRLFTGTICILALLMLVQDIVDCDFLNHCFPSNDAVVFNNCNHFAYMLCMAANAAVGMFLWDKSVGRISMWLYLLAYVLLIYTLLVNDTFGSVLAALFGLIFIYILFWATEGKPRICQWLPFCLFVLLVGLSVIGCLPLANGLGGDLKLTATELDNVGANSEAAKDIAHGRGALWMDTIARIVERPLFGYGPEGFYDRYAITLNTAPHNEFLQLAGYSGIPALLLYLAALVTLLLAQWKKRKQLSVWILIAAGATVTYLISACAGNPMFNTAPYYWLFLGLSAGTVAEKKPILCPAPVRESSARRGLSFSALVALVVSVLLGAICTFSFVTSMQNEKNREWADMAGIQCAVIAAQDLVEKGSVTEYTEYYYDPENFCLIEVGEGLPEGTGLGTDLDAGMAEKFAAEYGTDYGYVSRASYYNCIIQISIDPSNDNAIRVDWVAYPTEAAEA